MQDLIIEIMNNFGYIGVFLLIAIENVFPPIPSEVILLFGGFMTTFTNMNIIGVIIASTLGSLLGAIILYYIGKLLRLTPEDIDKADKWFDTKGNKTVFFCRFIPVIRSLISIPAGMSEMPMKKFLIYTTVGSLIWNSALTIAGSIVGENWTDILAIMDQYSHIIVIILAILFIIAIIVFYSKRKKKNNNKNKTVEK